MNKLYTYIEEAGGLLCEAFADPRLYQIANQLSQELKCGFKSALARWYLDVAWDKIKSEDITEYEKRDAEALKKMVRKAKNNIKNGSYVIFCMEKERLQGIVLASVNDFAWGHAHQSSWNNKLEWEWCSPAASARSGRKITINEILDKLGDYAYYIVVDISKYDTLELKRRRQDLCKDAPLELKPADHKSIHKKPSELGKSGGGISSELTYGSFYHKCQQDAEEAMKKWRKIVAENKFKRSSSVDTSEIDKLVESIMNKMMTVSKNMTAHPENYPGNYIGNISSSYAVMMDYVNDIIKYYGYYCKTIIEIKIGKSYNPARDSKEVEDYKTKIKEKADYVTQHYFVKFGV